jgi:hypothetical protein
MGKKIKIGIQDPGSYFESYGTKQFFGLKILKFFVADPYPGSGIF